MDAQPTGQETNAGSVSAFIEVLSEPALRTQLPPCPDWPDLN